MWRQADPPKHEQTIPLKEHLEALLAEKDKRDEQRFAAQAEAIATALASANRAMDQLGATGELRAEVTEIRTLINAQGSLTDAKFVTYRALIDSQAEKVALALASSDKAVGKAEVATEKRFESVNEFRKTLSDQTASFLPRTEYGGAHQALIDKIADIGARMDKTEGRAGGMTDGTKLLLQLGGFLIAAIGLYLALRP